MSMTMSLLPLGAEAGGVLGSGSGSGTCRLTKKRSFCLSPPATATKKRRLDDGACRGDDDGTFPPLLASAPFTSRWRRRVRPPAEDVRTTTPAALLTRNSSPFFDSEDIDSATRSAKRWRLGEVGDGTTLSSFAATQDLDRDPPLLPQQQPQDAVKPPTVQPSKHDERRARLLARFSGTILKAEEKQREVDALISKKLQLEREAAQESLQTMERHASEFTPDEMDQLISRMGATRLSD